MFNEGIYGPPSIPPPQQFLFVDTINDFPAAVGNVITLQDNYTYFITKVVDLNGKRLVGGQNTTLIGGSSENCRIKSTGLSLEPLITSTYSLPIRNITIEAEIALSLDASLNSNQALDWFGVNFTDCATIGTIKGYTNFIMSDSALLNSQGLTFDGTLGTIGFFQCLFDCRAGGTVITIPATTIVSRRFRVNYSSFICLAGETALNINTGASIQIEGYFLDTVNFSGGGSYTVGVQYNDNKAAFTNCRGVSNSGSIAQYYMQGNATATTVSATNTFYKIAGTTSAGLYVEKFALTDNKATYSGAIIGFFKVTAIITLVSGNNNVISGRVAFNGTTLVSSQSKATTNGAGRAENMVVSDIVQLQETNYIEIFLANNTAVTNITVEDINVIVERLN